MRRITAINLPIMKRLAYAMAALSLLIGIAYPVIRPKLASAAQLTTRSITISDSGASGGTITTGVGSGTNVTYKVAFTTSVSSQSVIIDFCAEDPIVGDTCTAPTGLSFATTSLVGGTGNITPAGWTLTSTAGQVKIARSTGTAATAGIQQFELTGVTNPSSVGLGVSAKPVGSFFSRIYTYSDTTFGATTTAYTTPLAPGDYKDYGGIALSTNRIITITARVQEQLTFCVSGSNQATWTTTNDCSDTQIGRAHV